MHTRTVIELDVENLVESLIETFREWEHDEPIADARYCLENALADSGDVTRPKLRGLVWEGYWTFRVAMDAATHAVDHARQLHPELGSGVVGLEDALTAGIVDPVVASERWAATAFARGVDAATASELAGEVARTVEVALRVFCGVGD